MHTMMLAMQENIMHWTASNAETEHCDQSKLAYLGSSTREQENAGLVHGRFLGLHSVTIAAQRTNHDGFVRLQNEDIGENRPV